MLREHRAQSYRYDAASDRIALAVRPPANGRAARRVPGSLLVSARGALVGVDLRGGAPMGEVVMWGPHEDVASTHDTEVELATDEDGDPAELTIPRASAWVRDAACTPYRATS
ncbi:MAG: hypothetical protein JNL38_25820 [Myxococcales bacterium]|jgi:hypothetical protein|nr:hypothetical protein [Myxococcales bacterium]